MPGPINQLPEWAWQDRTRRAWEVVHNHVLANGAACEGMWVAIRLSDGTSDGALYPTKMAATRYQLHETQCAYMCIPPFAEVKIGEIHAWLAACERVYDGGGRLSDAGTHIHPSALQY